MTIEKFNKIVFNNFNVIVGKLRAHKICSSKYWTVGIIWYFKESEKNNWNIYYFLLGTKVFLSNYRGFGKIYSEQITWLSLSTSPHYVVLSTTNIWVTITGWRGSTAKFAPCSMADAANEIEIKSFRWVTVIELVNSSGYCEQFFYEPRGPQIVIFGENS